MFLRKLGIENPVILAPMAGGPGTPELAAAVSNAGGLGSIGAAYLTPDQIAEQIRRMRALTDRPFSVNLFAGGYATESDVAPERMLGVMNSIHAGLGLPPPALPALARNPFREQVEAVIEALPAVFSFTFGIPGKETLSRIRARGILILGTATTVEEGRMLADAGVDAIIAQGSEAGGHRGTFAAPFEEAMVPTLELVRQIAGLARGLVPVIASGGIMDAGDLAAALSSGAEAAQLGTAFLACPESGASETYKQALLAARNDTTVITRAFSGRPARGLRNAFIEKLESMDDAILPFPIQNALTRGMRRAAAAQGKPGYLSLWAGQGVTRCRTIAARELVESLQG